MQKKILKKILLSSAVATSIKRFFWQKKMKHEKSSNYRSKTCISQKISKYLSRNTKKSGILLTFDGFMTNQKNRQIITQNQL